MTSPKLFEPFTLKGITARNRIVVSPMCQYQSRDGSPTDWHIVHMGRYAIGGAGIVFYEETAVEDRGRKTHKCAGLYRDDQIPEYRRIASFVKEFGGVPAMQLGHSGARASERGPLFNRDALSATNKADGGEPWQSISSSAVTPIEGKPLPRAMTQKDINDVVQAFADATVRTLQAGFEILEIHGAHGYLIQQFLSPVINKRNDAYGGDLKGRMRFALEVTEAVRRVWPDDKPLFFRVSSVDGKGGLWTLPDTVALSKELKALGVDLIDCSSGGLTGNSSLRAVPRIPGHHVPYAARVKQETGMLTMAPGLITEPQQAEELLQRGDIDLIAMARELMYSSDWPAHAARALNVPNYLELFPPEFTHRLKLREEHVAMPENRTATTVPMDLNS
ncbi:NADH:flavin oxidoreductase/NADH oxidase [Bradyrhizobium sp. LHD-71]|uniref:NADH:flavin oxidoreductase/NADH oxidase n=1 Tax=Bradyrhizobium sp. LHD-71 TaxID=3072141 RepID=UPI00280D2F1E|nr:NADH:flavin oxidoreductase/NADH oxidase [Bradyrhizobium sp. LHD-71]MDQ8727847.1 NADH:flavin oxidoreductase/NADH oxidase [Bradyrhizobium sp. LHD-71]